MAIKGFTVGTTQTGLWFLKQRDCKVEQTPKVGVGRAGSEQKKPSSNLDPRFGFFSPAYKSHAKAKQVCIWGALKAHPLLSERMDLQHPGRNPLQPSVTQKGFCKIGWGLVPLDPIVKGLESIVCLELSELGVSDLGLRLPNLWHCTLIFEFEES